MVGDYPPEEKVLRRSEQRLTEERGMLSARV